MHKRELQTKRDHACPFQLVTWGVVIVPMFPYSVSISTPSVLFNFLIIVFASAGSGIRLPREEEAQRGWSVR